MSNYNPYKSAFSAAIAELTSEQAKQYYAMRAQQDTQIAFDAALSIGCRVYEAAVLTYQFGQFCRALIETLAAEPVAPQLCLAGEVAEPMLLLPPAPAPLALPAAIQPHPDHIRWTRQAAKSAQSELPSSGEVIATPSFIPFGLLPPGADIEACCKQLIASIERTDAALADLAKPIRKRGGRPRKSKVA